MDAGLGEARLGGCHALYGMRTPRGGDGCRRRSGAVVGGAVRDSAGAAKILLDENLDADDPRYSRQMVGEFRGGGGEGFRRPHQSAALSRQPARLDSATDR